MTRLMALIVVAFALGTASAHAADVFQTTVRNAILIDAATETVLYEKAPDEAAPPASLAKLMTLLLAFDEIKRGTLALDREMTVSVDVWRRGGAPSRTSAMYLAPNTKVSIANLLRGTIIPVGNDAAMMLAQAVSGSEIAFTQQMNRSAQALGLTSTLFANPTGLPDGEQKTTARDMAKLALHLVREHKDQLPLFAEKDFNWSNIRQQNRNPLIAMTIGADGFMPGFVEEIGYSLVGTAQQGDQRLIVVVMGAKTQVDRGNEARRLLEWGFRSFELKTVFDAGEEVASVPVVGGLERAVPVRVKNAVHLLVPRAADGEKITGQLRYRGPLKAPLAQDQKIGTLQLQRGSLVSLEVPVHAGRDVERGPLLRRARDAVLETAGASVRNSLRALWARLTRSERATP